MIWKTGVRFATPGDNLIPLGRSRSCWGLSRLSRASCSYRGRGRPGSLVTRTTIAMNWLAENALPIWMGGAVALTMALVVYFQTRTQRCARCDGGVVVVAAALLAGRIVVSKRRARRSSERSTSWPRRSKRTMWPARSVISRRSADAQIRKDVETLMPLVKIERARIIGTPEIDVGDGKPDAPPPWSAAA